MAEDPIRTFMDRSVRAILQQADNLRELLESAVPLHAAGFDCARARLIEGDFLLPDWRGREADLIFEIPYRVGNSERLALVCLLIEHQSRPDARMPLRTLVYTSLYWDRYSRTWEASESEGKFRLPPVLSIVVHTGPQPWTSPRSIAEMLAEPAGFHHFAPIWAPILWDLYTHTTDELAKSDAMLLQALSVVRAEGAEREEFERAFRIALTRLSESAQPGSAQWSDLVKFVLGWAANRRPPGDRSALQAVAEEAVTNEVHRREIQAMGRTIADAYRDEGRAEGMEKGRAEGMEKGLEKGMEKGQAKGIQLTLLRLGRRQFGEPDSATVDALRAITDLERLGRLSDALRIATSWTDLLATP